MRIMPLNRYCIAALWAVVCAVALPTGAEESGATKELASLQYKPGAVVSYKRWAEQRAFHFSRPQRVEDVGYYRLSEPNGAGIWKMVSLVPQWPIGDVQEEDPFVVWNEYVRGSVGPRGIDTIFLKPIAGEVSDGISHETILDIFPPLPWFPVAKNAPSVGDAWQVKVPAFVFLPLQRRRPHAPHAVLKQVWKETVDYEGYRCAKIDYSYEDAYTVEEAALASLPAWLHADCREMAGISIGVSWSGTVFFAIDGGVVVADRAVLRYRRDGSLQADWRIGRLLTSLSSAEQEPGDPAAEPKRGRLRRSESLDDNKQEPTGELEGVTD